MEWLERTWPGLVAFLLSPATLAGLTAFSVLCFVASVLCATWAVRRLPVDYLLCEPARRHRHGWGVVIWVLRNLGGLVQNGFNLQLDAAKVVDAFLPEPFPDYYEELQIPLYVVATDFQSWHQAVFNSGLLRPTIAGSIAIPSFFKPVAFANHLLVDGGVVNPLPLDQASTDVDIVVGIDVNGDPSDRLHRADYRALDIWFGSAQIMMHSLTAHMMAAYPPDVYVRPHLNGFGALEFWRVREIVAHVEKDKDNFKRALDRKIEAFMHHEAQSMRAEDR